MGRGLVASTAAGTVAARHATEDPRVSVLLDGERRGPPTVVLRLTVRCEVQHLRLWRLRTDYYKQADAVWIEVRPTAAELLSVPG
jgi:hypothetical protein